MYIQTKKCIIRDFEFSDVKSLAEYANNINIWDNLPDMFPYPYNQENAYTFIESLKMTDTPNSFAICINDLVVGSIGYHLLEDSSSIEVGYWLGEPFWGQGIATDALQGYLNYIFENTEITKVFAKVYSWNIASQKVLERCGFLEKKYMPKSMIKNNIPVDGYIYTLRKHRNHSIEG